MKITVCLIGIFLFFSDLTKAQLNLDTSANEQVIIVGAGAAGLYAGKMLEDLGIPYQILEASDRIGGRIWTLNEFADFPVELGAEEVHGMESVWHDMLEDSDVELAEEIEEQESYIMLEGKLHAESDLEGTEDWKKLQEVERGIGTYKGQEMTVAQYLKKRKIPEYLYPIINAYYGNEYGTSIDRISIKSLKKSWRKWSSGEDNLPLKNKSHWEVLQEQFKEVIPKVQLNRPVAKIDYKGNIVRLSSSNGEEYEGRWVILTVPLNVLKHGLIEFRPELPAEKKLAIQNLRMGAGLKIIMKFREAFWPKGTGSIYGEGLIPEFWTVGAGRREKGNVLTAFVMGEGAETLSDQGTFAINTALRELDEIFGEGVASGSFSTAYIIDWQKQIYVRGAYSYPTPNSEKYRRWLSWSVNDKLFFAGEAANTNGHYATVHGAIETAIEAVKELEEVVFKYERKKKKKR